MLIIPVFIPHLGCPHDCCFCNQRSISGVQKAPTAEEIVKIIESYRDIAPNYDETQLAFFGGSFTAIPEEEQEYFLQTVFPYVKASNQSTSFIDSIRLSTRPDAITERILNRLKKYGVSTIELGAQSMDNESLKASNRGHSAEDTIKSSRLIREYGFTLGLQTMPGLPGSGFEKDIETAKKIIEQKPSIVRIYPTIVIRGTALHKMMLLDKYKPMELEEAVELCAILTEMYENAGIKVIRLGLHSSENMCEERDVAAGPYHPAFGDMVYGRRKLKEVMVKIREICSKNTQKCTDLNIFVPRDQISTFVGNRRCNVAFLMKKYGFQRVKVLPKDREISENITGNILNISF